MASYYYLISSLPDIRPDGDMPITYEEFLDCCRTNVSEETYQLLCELPDASSKGPLIGKWAESYGALMGELNYQRSIRLGKTHVTAFESDSEGAQAADAALNAANPLEAEKVLLEYEFQLLDSLTAMHYFDDYVLIGYAIKLKLLERQECFTQEKGKQEFKHLIDNVQKQVYGL